MSDALRAKSSVGAHLLHTFGSELGITIPAGNQLRMARFLHFGPDGFYMSNKDVSYNKIEYN